MPDIVIGVDESPGAAAALSWAVREAGLHGWTAKAVLAWGLLDQHHTSTDQPFDPSYSKADALRALDTAIVQAMGADAARSVQREAVCDLPARALLEASEGADLLVVGARGLGGFKRLLLGSVSEQCLHHASCPVAIVHAHADLPARERIVVGVDGSEEAQQALRWALDEARASKATLEVVHAWQPPFLAGYPYLPRPVDTDVFEDAAQHLIDTALEHVDLDGLDKPVERTLVSGGAASAILEAADHADLVVVGSRGAGGFRGLLLGSVSQQVARHAPCPVVVVRPADVQRDAVG
jgi:nucleotide-binding universal stress UspA family protein